MISAGISNDILQFSSCAGAMELTVTLTLSFIVLPSSQKTADGMSESESV